MKNPFSKKAPSQQEAFLRTYLDCIAPGIVKFEVDHYIFGSTYRCVWALREYPASTEAQALLRELGEKSGVTLRIYCRQVSPGEEDRIIDNANKKNKLDGSDPNKLRQAVAAELHRAYLQGCVGQTYPVLFEQRKDGCAAGHAPNYMPVEVQTQEDYHNTVRHVKITGVVNDILMGEVT